MSTAASLDLAAQIVLSHSGDSMKGIDALAQQMLAASEAIVWEVDATNLRFKYVSPSAEMVLGYPVARWLQESSFWSDHVVYEEDRPEAISALALSMGNGVDGDVTVRLLNAAGRIRPFRMFIHVVPSERGVATRLRGLLVAVQPSASDEPLLTGTGRLPHTQDAALPRLSPPLQ